MTGSPLEDASEPDARLFHRPHVLGLKVTTVYSERLCVLIHKRQVLSQEIKRALTELHKQKGVEVD